MNGDRQDIPYSGRIIVPSPNTPITATSRYQARRHDQRLLLRERGTIRVGANSTGVEITGTAASDHGLHLFNTGTIDATQGGASAAIRLNADNNLDSYAVNVGTIAGNITFGAGDDRLMNTLMSTTPGG